METTPLSNGSAGAEAISRREALRRTALLAGLAFAPALLERAGKAHAAAAAPNRRRNLTATQFATVTAVAERILPRTDTPGATDVGVPEFIDVMSGDYMTGEERTAFVNGLAWIEARSTAAHSKPFPGLSAQEQDALLAKLMQTPVATELAFLRQIKELTIVGYFTSEQVGKNVTGYDPVPGRFEACVPLTEIGNRSWTR